MVIKGGAVSVARGRRVGQLHLSNFCVQAPAGGLGVLSLGVRRSPAAPDAGRWAVQEVNDDRR